MKRSPMPPRRSELPRGKALERGGHLARKTRLRAQPKPPEQRDAEAAVRAVVFARDGGCLMARIEPERCFGRLTFHHLEKDGQGGDYTPENGVCLCASHNSDVEDHPRRYRLLGLVVRPGIDHTEAAARRAAAGLTPKGPRHG